MPLTLTDESTEFITLAEVKAHTNVTGTSNDAELDLFRGAAQDAVEGLIGPVLHRTVTETHRAGGTVILRQSPVLTIDTVTRGVYAVAGVSVDTDAGIVYGAGWGPMTVTYTVGRAVVPDAVRVAALIIAEHLWTTQRGTGPSMVMQGDEVVPVPGMAYSIPNRATDLLRPYLLPPAVG